MLIGARHPMLYPVHAVRSDCFGLKHFLDAGHEDAWIKIADFQTLGRLDLDMHRMP